MSYPAFRPRIILASGSPRRRELLAEAGYLFEVRRPRETAECGVCSAESPAELVARLAYQKTSDVATGVDSGIIVGCDTVAECHGRILGKPRDETDARQMLELLRGREHRVWSGLCVWKVPEGRPDVRVACTVLRMDVLSDAQIADYLASGAWEGKAGGFGYQDRLGWVHITEGSPSNVVGLPMELLAEMLSGVTNDS
ncbi:MAG: Maf family protein [Thermoguttaceae bacterium]